MLENPSKKAPLGANSRVATQRIVAHGKENVVLKAMGKK